MPKESSSLKCWSYYKKQRIGPEYYVMYQKKLMGKYTQKNTHGRVT